MMFGGLMFCELPSDNIVRAGLNGYDSGTTYVFLANYSKKRILDITLH